MRKLIVARIVHSPEDMGSMREGLERMGVSRLGREKWEENRIRIERFWDELEREIDRLELDPTRLRIYQDGLPAGGEIGERIIRETASKGSRNYQIIEKLMERGARIEATESPELLLREYQHIKAMVSTTGEEQRRALEAYNKEKDRLLDERDAYIARRIAETLQDDETGLLFIGAHHNVVPRLPADVEVSYLGDPG
ncbi:MAG: hypothetical protein H5T42_05820 [Methanothrix sp.]|jgi:hypothetical protein|uniref:Uncharacterized protein n=1 Tax=Methanothrix thermoacetophila (strain DSM 6194 / JCM 14653 / NBRC 101360 / PT) TaxID=349307 RepID=A0B580_METTP|nr:MULTISPECIES: hypothetical protein [Methanothrix]ABK13854.1 conserved hypothetical protein [Methanothrix thermoacetophila PT]MBC7079970.1 hypothetical protein [Methanothrix sp.]NPU88119.1 hypothetical protein [Methanothrix sp.]